MKRAVILSLALNACTTRFPPGAPPGSARSAVILSLALLAGCGSSTHDPIQPRGNLIAIDGDTFRDSDGVRYRLARIDAPEMPGHCRGYRLAHGTCAPGDPYASQRALQWLLDRSPQVVCTFEAVDIYGRKVVDCREGYYGEDLSDTMLGMGQAIPYRFEGKASQ